MVIYIFKIIIWRGNYFGRWSFDFILPTNEDGLCHSARITFPGDIKGCVTRSRALFPCLIPAADRLHKNEKSAFNIWATVSLGDHSFIIYSFLLDQLDLETSGWMLNSCSDLRNSYLLFVRLTVRRISPQADIKVFGTRQYSRPLICFTSFFI